MKRLISQALMYFLIVMVMFQWFDPLGSIYYQEAWRYGREMTTSHPLYGHAHKDTAMCSYYSNTLICIENGFRVGFLEPPTLAVKKDGVLILGDSIVLGWGVRCHDTFMQLIMFGKPWLNIKACGVGSWNTESEAAWFAHEGVKLKSKHLILIVCPNDVEPEQWQPDSGYNWGRLAIKIRLWATVKHFIRVHQVKDKLDLIFENDERLSQVRVAGEEIKRLCEASNIKLHVFMYSDLKSSYGQKAWDFYQTIFPQMQRFSDQIYSHKISYIDGHPDAEGHRLMAKEIWLNLKDPQSD